MTTELGSLQGISLLVSPIDEPWKFGKGRLSPESEAEKTALDIAGSAGVTITRISFKETAEWSALEQPDTFSFGGYRQYREQQLQKLASDPKAPKLPWTQRLTASTPITEETVSQLPLVLASDAQGGEGKYLLERPRQLHIAQQYIKELGDNPQRGIELFELRQFIPTPSEHFTSYRVLTTPTGDALAAGLLYSGHTADQYRRVGDVPSRLARYGFSAAIPLEDPHSPYYLGAADIRSNLQQGGRSIPLMGGDHAREISPYEASILEAHNIDPTRPDIPPALRTQAQYIGRTIGKGAGLVAGLDFLQHRDSGELYFLEANATPGTRTYAECHYGTRPDVASSQLRQEMLVKSLASISCRSDDRRAYRVRN